MIKWLQSVLNVDQKYTTHITIGSIIVNLLAVIYSISLFLSAAEIKRNVGDYINMISENDGNVLPMFLIIAGVLCLPSNIMLVYLMYTLLSSSKNRQIYTLMSVLLMAVLGTICIILIICVMVITHSYSKHEALHDGITEAMNNYSSNSLFKSRIDKLQLQFECCGSQHYDEWYNIVWYDTNLMKHKENHQSTPFSCCSIRSMFTCIHHSIESNSLPYRYSHDLNFSLSPYGCTNAIKQRKKSVGWGIIGQIIFMVLIQLGVAAGVKVVQTIYLENDQFSNEDTNFTSWLFNKKGKEKNSDNVDPSTPDDSKTGEP